MTKHRLAAAVLPYRVGMCFLMFFVCAAARSQDTFSIVAVDTTTGEIGSAGASCVGPINGVGAFILSDVLEGIGAIHTQASYLQANQLAARQRMLLGDSPQEIINYLVANDAQGNPSVRQYGIVDLVRRGASAAYTGSNCIDYKNHVTGPGYAVQGNILLGQVIIDTMQSTYLNAHGPLADRLMRALEAAMIIGADTRCASRGTSSRSAFLKVVRIGDGPVPYLQKVVPDSPVGVDPIGILRQQFDLWKDSLFFVVDPFRSQMHADADSLPANGTSQTVITIIPRNNSDSLLPAGLGIQLTHTGLGTLGAIVDSGNGRYAVVLTSSVSEGTDTLRARIISSGDTVWLAATVTVHYIVATSVNEWSSGLPAGTVVLHQNYPNPFNPSTAISYQLPALSFVSLKVFDMLGREITTLHEGVRDAGTHRIVWDAGGMPGGVYWYRLSSNAGTQTGKMVVVK